MGSSWIQINLIEDGPEFIIGAGGKHPVEDAEGGMKMPVQYIPFSSAAKITAMNSA